MTDAAGYVNRTLAGYPLTGAAPSGPDSAAARIPVAAPVRGRTGADRKIPARRDTQRRRRQSSQLAATARLGYSHVSAVDDASQRVSAAPPPYFSPSGDVTARRRRRNSQRLTGVTRQSAALAVTRKTSLSHTAVSPARYRRRAGPHCHALPTRRRSPGRPRPAARAQRRSGK